MDCIKTMKSWDGTCGELKEGCKWQGSRYTPHSWVPICTLDGQDIVIEGNFNTGVHVCHCTAKRHAAISAQLHSGEIVVEQKDLKLVLDRLIVASLPKSWNETLSVGNWQWTCSICGRQSAKGKDKIKHAADCKVARLRAVLEEI